MKPTTATTTTAQVTTTTTTSTTSTKNIFHRGIVESAVSKVHRSSLRSLYFYLYIYIYIDFYSTAIKISTKPDKVR